MKNIIKYLAVLVACLALPAMAAINPKVIYAGIDADGATVAIGYDAFDVVKLKNSGSDPAIGIYELSAKMSDDFELPLDSSIETVAGGSEVTKLFPRDQIPGVYNSTATWTVGGIVLSKSFSVNVVEVTELKATGPSYIPSTNLDGEVIEAEKKDLITLTVTMSPIDDGSLVTWSGDGVSGTGLSQTVTYSTTGSKTITATCGTSSVTTIICVNDNASSPFAKLEVETDKYWAHATETVTLTARGEDHDWFYGKLYSTENQLDLEHTGWSVAEGNGSFDPPSAVGGKVKWIPPSNKTSPSIGIFATFNDKDPIPSSYTPRDELSQDKTANAGVFKVQVKCIVTTSGLTGNETVSTLDEDGVVIGAPTAGTSFASSLAASAATGHTNDTIVEDDHARANIVWTYQTIPANAEPEGTISADLSVRGSCLFSGTVDDGDIIDNPISVSIGIPGTGISVGVSFGEDDNEGIAVAAAAFKPDSDSGFSTNLPGSTVNNLTLKSRDFDENKLPMSKSKNWLMEEQTITHVRNQNQTVTVDFFFHAEAQAHKAHLTWGLDKTPSASATVGRLAASRDFANVRYRKPGSE